MKQRGKWIIMASVVFIAGCGTTSTTTTSFDGIQIDVPTAYMTVNSAQMDNYQIINKILKVYKKEKQTLIVARSSLNASLSPSEYASTSKEKLSQ
jgi:hypothetical protein